MCSALSCAARSARCRASALAKTSARSRSRAISSSGQRRSSRTRADREAARHRAALDERGPRRSTVCRIASRVCRSIVASPGRSPGAGAGRHAPGGAGTKIHGASLSRIDLLAGGGTPSRVHECVSRTSSDDRRAPRWWPGPRPRSSTMRRSPVSICRSTSSAGQDDSPAERSERRVSNRRRSARLCWARRRWPTLDQQGADEPALDEHDTDRPDDVPSIALPQGRLLEQHDAPGGQAPTIDPPALERAGVEHVRIGALARGVGRSQPLASEDPKRERCRARGLLFPPHDVAPDDAPSDMHVEGGVDRNRCGARDVLHHLGVGERAAGAVAQEQTDEDDRVLGQSRGLLQHLLECAIGQLDRLEAVPIARGHPLELDGRGRRRTRARDERDAARVRMELQDELHVGAPVAIQPHARDVGGSGRSASAA